MCHLGQLLPIITLVSRQKLSIFLFLPVNIPDHGLVLPGNFPDKRRTALQIFPQVHVKGQKFPVYCLFVRVHLTGKSEQHLIAVRSGRAVHKIALGLIKIRQRFIHSKRSCKTALQVGQRVGKLVAVVIKLHHFLNLFQAKHLVKGQPFGGKHFIWRPVQILDAVFCRPFLHFGALQHFQETKLQLFRFHAVHPVKRFPKTLVILKRQTCDQIQMLVDIVVLTHPIHIFFQTF